MNKSLAIAVALLAIGFFPKPEARSLKPDSVAAPSHAATSFSRLVLLPRNSDAFKAKRKLIDDARSSIDLSYFIIEDDPTSARILEDLLRKPSRVRIRVLVDYFMSQNQLPALMLLDAAPNIEVRRYGPPTPEFTRALAAEDIDPTLFVLAFMGQKPDLLVASVQRPGERAASRPPTIGQAFGQYLREENPRPGTFLPALVFGFLEGRTLPNLAGIRAGFDEFMRRTHHKLLVADRRCFVMGGRNLSDEYHADLGDALLKTRRYPFQDTDVTGCEGGSDLQAQSFERLWTDPRSVGLADRVLVMDGRPPVAMTRRELEKRADRASHIRGTGYSAASAALPPLTGALVENAAITAEYVRQLQASTSGERVDIVTAYFYADVHDAHPGELGQLATALVDAARRGVRVSIYTNSMASTDLSMVNLLAYGSYRALAQAGVQIHELAPGQGSLHSKTAVFGSRVLLVGSYNFDPRSHLYDTNNLIALNDNAAGDATRAFRRTRVDGLRWTPVTPDAIGRIEKELEKRRAEILRLRIVRDLL